MTYYNTTYLYQKFNIVFNIHKNGNQFKLYVRAQAMKLLVSLIKAYVINHYYYKIKNK